MEKKKGLKAVLREKLPLLVLVLCLIQPVMDVAGFWQNKLGISNTLTMLLRMMLLGGTVLLGFCLSDRKRCYVIAAFAMLLLTAGHVFACLQSPKGYEEPVLDLINLIRIYFMPLSTLCFITFLRQNDRVFEAMKKGMVLDLLIIFVIQLISALTKTNPYTYAADKVGILGWFMWTNSQSAILSMIAPIAICWSIVKWKSRLLPVILITIVSEATLYLLAPRLSYASLIACGFGLFVCLMIADRRYRKPAAAILLITVLFIGAYPISPTHSRLNANQTRTDKAKEELETLHIVIPTKPPVTETETLPTDETLETGETETVPPTEKPTEEPEQDEIILDGKTAKQLEKFYRSHHLMWSMLERFGAKRVFEIYEYTLDPTILGNTRLMKINFCRLAMEDSGLASKLFGLDLTDMTAKRYDAKSRLVTDNYDVENDFHGMYFLTGIVGLVLMCVFLLWFGIRALVAVLRKPNVFFNLEIISFALAYGLGMIHAYFTASVLRRNNASIYMAMVLAGLWYLTEKKLLADPKTGKEA